MNKPIFKIGFWSAFIAMVAFNLAQILQLPCVLIYPADQVLIFRFSHSIVIPFLLAMLALHYTILLEKNAGAIRQLIMKA